MDRSKEDAASDAGDPMPESLKITFTFGGDGHASIDYESTDADIFEQVWGVVSGTIRDSPSTNAEEKSVTRQEPESDAVTTSSSNNYLQSNESVWFGDKRYSQAEVNQLESDVHGMHSAGIPVKQIAADLGLLRHAVTELLGRRGVLVSRQTPDDEDIADMKRRYEAGQSLYDVGAAVGFDFGVVRYHLVKHGVVMRDRRGRPKEPRHE